MVLKNLSSRLIRDSIKAFLMGTKTERYGVSRTLQRVLRKPEYRTKLFETLTSVKGRASDIPYKIMDFRKALTGLGKGVFPLDLLAKDCLSSMLAVGQLQVHKLDPLMLSESTIDYLIKAEKVHPVDNKLELIKRLVGNRLGLGLYHSAFGERQRQLPLAMIYVALTDSMPLSIQEVWDSANAKPPLDPTFAIFYTISLCHDGAQGLDLGRSLILKTLPMLTLKYPTLRNFQTLSPIIKFKDWQVKQPVSVKEEDCNQQCTRYLNNCYKGTTNPMDPVAAFHYRNGAILSQVISNANPRATNSFGMMASYGYEPDKLVNRSQKFIQRIRVIRTRA